MLDSIVQSMGWNALMPGKDEVSRTWLHDETEQARRESVAVALVCAARIEKN